MEDLNLDFLAEVELVEVAKTATASTARHEGPTNGADLRLYKSGKIYPSKEFAEMANLEFLPKGVTVSADGRTAMGIDIIDSSAWINYPKGLANLIFVMFTAKKEPRVDLFNTTHYSKEDGITPVSSVFTQGASKGAKDLVSLVSTIYGAFQDEETKYVDLKVVTNKAMKIASNVYQIPKVKAKGNGAGEITYARRENPVGAFPLVIFVDPKASMQAHVEVAAPVEAEKVAPVAQAVAPQPAPVQQTVAPAEPTIVAAPAAPVDVFAQVNPTQEVANHNAQTVEAPAVAQPAPVASPIQQVAPAQFVAAPVTQPIAVPVEQIVAAEPILALPEDFIFETPVAPMAEVAPQPVFTPNAVPTNEVVNGKTVNGGEVLQAVGANAFEQKL